MFNEDDQQKLDRFTRGIVRLKINQLIGRAGFTEQDRESLEQEMLARVLQGLKAFDAAKSHRNVFVTTVVERFVANILRNKQAAKRDHRRICSLSVMITVTDEGPIELAQTIGRRELDARRGRYPRTDEDLAQLMFDMASVLDGLPEDLRELAERRKTQTMHEIAEAMGVPRTTLNYWVRLIRRRFEKAGLKDYL